MEEWLEIWRWQSRLEHIVYWTLLAMWLASVLAILECALHQRELRGVAGRAQVLRHEARRGLALLASIAATAPFVGFIGVCFAIVGSFRGICGEKTAMMAALAWSLGMAWLPAALSLLVAIPAHAAYRYLTARAEQFGQPTSAA